MTSRLVPAIAVVVVIDGVLLATGVIGPAAALALFVAVEAPLGAIVVTGYARRYRAHRAAIDGAGTITRRHALRALAADDPYLRLAAAEGRTLASLGRWIARRPDVPDGTVALGYSRGTRGIPVAMAVAASIELVAVHLLVPWPTVRLVLDLLGLYGLVVVLGWLAGRIVRPHLLTADALVLRSGPHICARVPLEAIAAVRPDRRLSPTAAGITDDADAGASLALPGPDGTTLSIELNQAVPASIPGYPWSAPLPREVRAVRLHLDDADAAARAMRLGSAVARVNQATMYE